MFPIKNNHDNIISQKIHYFQYKDTYTKSLEDKINKKANKIVVKDELNFLSDLGFSKNDYSDFLSKIFFNCLADNANKKKNESNLTNFHINYTKQKEEEKMNNIKIEQEHVKRDFEYVRFLDDWEQIILPKIEIKK